MLGLFRDDAHLQIFIDGIGLLSGGHMNFFPQGSSPADFGLFSADFNTGDRSSVTVAFAINGGGTARVGVSFDDFFLNSEPIPEPSTFALLGIGVVVLGACGWRRRQWVP